MTTISDLKKRYPAMDLMTQDRFDVLLGDAQLMMGTDESRWLGWYVPAQCALIAHWSATIDDLLPGEAPLPALPVSRTDVDDVQVEFSDRMISEIPYMEASWYSTVYGQQYVMWRRMAFAGPRVA
ncbi:virion structural protein [Erwinia phage Faunus]|uniref:Uncharacterized protein n=1 Tax=Erwinia phage Faunus TaxID=2182346 RepID=A0A2U8UWU0_9CAUD|nr:virion structural protein [Erwinia phage Faunus]AWN08638.1 hypothetical protein [Erwinia phage Faunus]